MLQVLSAKRAIAKVRGHIILQSARQQDLFEFLASIWRKREREGGLFLAWATLTRGPTKGRALILDPFRLARANAISTQNTTFASTCLPASVEFKF